MKFRALESRVYPVLGLTVEAGEVVDLPEDTDVAGLVKVEPEKKPAKADAPTESE